MSSNHFCQISLPPEDCKLILEQDLPSTSTLTDSFCSMHGWGGVAVADVEPLLNKEINLATIFMSIFKIHEF